MNKMKKTSAALMAATVLAVAAPTVGLMPATTAYAAETTAKNGITVKTDAEFLKARPYEGAELLPYYSDWKHTFEISCSEDAFNSNSDHSYTLEYLVPFTEGYEPAVEIAWDCDATIKYPPAPSGAYFPEREIFEGSRNFGANYIIDVLDGDISPFFTNNGVAVPVDKIPEDYVEEMYGPGGKYEEFDLKYHLGSKNGVDYNGAGTGVYFPLGVEKNSNSSDDSYISYCIVRTTIEFNQPGAITLTIKDRTETTKPTTPTTPSNPTVSTKEQSFHDETNNIIVEGNFPEGTKLETKVLLESATRNSYDISLLDENGKKIQPNGMATVKLPLPESWKGKDVFVYYVDDGKYTAFESTIEGDYIVFKTNHFSEYVLTTEKVENKTETNPATGVSAAAALGVIALAGAFAIVSRKKR